MGSRRSFLPGSSLVPRERLPGGALTSARLHRFRSQGASQPHFDARGAANPRTLVAMSGQRGYLRLDVTPQRLTADLITMDTVKAPDSGRTTAGSYVIETGRLAPVPA
jgi:hypothetical protein